MPDLMADVGGSLLTWGPVLTSAVLAIVIAVAAALVVRHRRTSRRGRASQPGRP